MDSTSDIYHPEWLELENTLGSRPQLTGNQEIDVPTFNAMGEQLAAQWPKIEDELIVVNDMIPPASEIPSMDVRIYSPQFNPGDLPLIVYFHGGGYLSGNITTEDPHCRILSSRTPAVVVNVDYPLAPLHNLDTIIAAGIRAVNYASTHSPSLTTSSTLLVAGGSAGASLAIQITYQFATSPEAFPVPLSGLIALFPFCAPVDAYDGPFASRHQSYNSKATDAPILTKKVILSMSAPLQANPTLPKHYPLLAPSLSSFPRTYVVTAEHDPCRDDGRILALRLADESPHGVREDYYEHLPHYFHWFPQLNVARECLDKIVRGVRWVIEGAGPGDGKE